MIVRTPIKKFDVTNRLQIQARLQEGANEPIVWGRWRLAVRHAMGEHWYWLTSNELFMNLNTVPGRADDGFAQDRIYAGVGRTLNRHVRMEGGYMAQIINRDSPAHDRINHVLLLQLFLAAP